MQHRSNYTYAGSTARVHEAPAFSAQELLTLCEHLSGCSRKSGGLDLFWNIAQRVHVFAAARLVTTCASVAFLGWIILSTI